MWKGKGGGADSGLADPGLPPTDFIFCCVTPWWALMPLIDDRVEVELVCFGCGPSNPCDACMASCDWLVLFTLDQMVCFSFVFSQIPAYIVSSKDMWNVGILLAACV
jgi:hypothetical protein